MIRVLVVDDHAVVRLGLRELVSHEPDILIAGEAENAQQALEMIRRDSWDVVVLDINMPGRSGLELLQDIKREQPRLPVLVLSIYPEEHYAVPALKSGASGYLVKNSPPEELVRAIRKLHTGSRYISAQLAEILAGSVRSDYEEVPHEKLSAREFEVLRLISSGKTVCDIADLLALSPKTVSTYRARLLEKMGLKNNAEVTHYAARLRLID